MFPTEVDFKGRPIDAAYAASRMRNEPLIELKQIKGTSETHPLLSPNDEFGGFEIMSFLLGDPSGRIPHIVGSYARQALKDGIAMSDTKGFNPYKFGFGAAADSHNTGVGYRQDNWFGAHGAADGMIDLGALGEIFPGFSQSGANDINEAGQVVGGSSAAGGTHAFLWTPSTGMVDLGTSVAGKGTFALGVSADGQVAVGYQEQATGFLEGTKWVGTRQERVPGPDGFVYGLTVGQNGFGLDGIVFRSDLDGNFQKIAKVVDTEIGRVPYGQMYRAQDGKLYGQCLYQACCSTVGTYFSIDTTQWIDSITPGSGPASGGTNVSIAGAGFVGGAEVSFDTEAASGEAVPDAQHVTAVTPATLTPGTVSTVKVRLPDTTLILLDRGWFADFLDVSQGDTFHAFVEWAVRNGVTAGCGSGLYCRNNPVTRGQMAVFLEKVMRGPAFIPPFCTHAFPDVPCSNPFASWIEQLAADGITTGCGGGNYCPDDPVLRQQMAVFLMKARHGSAFDPPDCAGIFEDVPCTPGTGFSDWIEQLVAEAITGGCSVSPALYCPGSAVTRGQMAVFLEKTFDLP